MRGLTKLQGCKQTSMVQESGKARVHSVGVHANGILRYPVLYHLPNLMSRLALITPDLSPMLGWGGIARGI